MKAQLREYEVTPLEAEPFAGREFREHMPPAPHYVLKVKFLLDQEAFDSFQEWIRRQFGVDVPPASPVPGHRRALGPGGYR